MRSRAPLAALVLFVTAACGNGSSSENVGAGAVQPTAGAAVPVLALDAGQWSTLRVQLVPSSSGAGVWLWSQSANDSRVWHWDPAVGKAASWSLGADSALRGGAAAPQLAACSSGVWFGVDHTLVSLDPATGAVSNVAVPAAPPVPAVDAHRPPELRGLAAVDALACDGTDVVVGLAGASQAFRYHPQAGSFDPIALPDGTEVVSIARSDAGELALGLQDYVAARPHVVMVLGSRGTRMVEVDDSTHVATAGSAFLSGVRAQSIARGESAAGPARQTLLAPDVNPTLGLRSLPDGRVVVATATGLRIVDPAGQKAAENLSLGRVPCLERTGTPAAKPTPGSAPPQPPPTVAQLCAVTARAFTVDPAGNIFAVVSNALTIVQVTY